MQKWIYASAKKKGDCIVQAFCYGDAPVHFVEIPSSEIVNDFGYNGPHEYMRFQIDSQNNEVRFPTWISKSKCDSERLISHSGSYDLKNSKTNEKGKIIPITVIVCFTFILGVTIYSLNRKPTVYYSGSSSYELWSQQRELDIVKDNQRVILNAFIDYLNRD